MKVNSVAISRATGSRSGYTIMEVMMAGSISVIVLGALMTLVFQMAKEQKFGLADGSVQYKAGLVEDKITQILRVMSVDESAVFADAVSGNPATFRRVIFARGPSSEFPREEMYFNSTNGVLIHDPNRNLSGDQVTLFSPDKFTALRDVYFYPSLKVGNMVDNTTINVVLKFDDDGYSMRKESSGEIKRMTVNRYFTVKFRN